MLGGADSVPRDEGEAVVRVAIAALDKAMAIEDGVPPRFTGHAGYCA
jgi:hypothetical protein